MAECRQMHASARQRSWRAGQRSQQRFFVGIFARDSRGFFTIRRNFETLSADILLSMLNVQRSVLSVHSGDFCLSMSQGGLIDPVPTWILRLTPEALAVPPLLEHLIFLFETRR